MADNVESPPPSGFFSRRAKLFPKKNAEELRAATELVNKIQEENSKISEVELAVSPFPTKKSKTTKKRGKKKEQKQDKEEVKDDSFSEVLLSSASKRRLKKLREEQELELQRIEAENEKILSAVDVNSNYYVETVNQVFEDFEKIAVLTIMYLNKVSRLKCYQNDKFSGIFPKVAELFNLAVTEFLLCFNARNITVDDTPKSLNLTDRDILECIPYKASDSTETEDGDNGNTFKIMFQSNDSKIKIDMLVHRIEKMQCIMKRYAEQRNLPLEQLIFDFDGERLSGDETPADLDMESESCIDVTVLATSADVDMESESCIDATVLATSADVDMESKSCIDVTVLVTSPESTPTKKTPARRRGRGRGRGRKRKS